MKKNQKGFGTVEGILIVIIIVIIGAVGVYVWSNKDSNKSTPANTNQSEQGTKKEIVKEETSASNEYLEISEWKIKLKNVEASKMTYEYKLEPGVDYYENKYETSVTPLIKDENLKDKTCKLGFMIYQSSVKPKTADDVKIGDKYYWSDGGPGPCSANADTNPDDILKSSIIRDFSTKKLEAL